MFTKRINDEIQETFKSLKMQFHMVLKQTTDLSLLFQQLKFYSLNSFNYKSLTLERYKTLLTMLLCHVLLMCCQQCGLSDVTQ